MLRLYRGSLIFGRGDNLYNNGRLRDVLTFK